MDQRKLFLGSLSALLSAGAPAAAQDLHTSLPLTSIGDALKWTTGDQTLTLDVPTTGQVRLELYSPRLDPRDYRSDTYYGDESYAPAQSISTTFTLLRADGTPVLSRTFTPGTQAWETLFDQTLPAGRYVLRTRTQGAGKNTFAVRLAGVNTTLSAERLTVNVHSHEWVQVANVTTDAQGYVLRMYDGDGPTELEAQLRDARGRVYPLTVGGDLSHSDLPIPAQAGTYTVELRQAPGARQFSNSVGFLLTRQGVPRPITVAQVRQNAQLRVTAELVLPGQTTPTAADLIIGSEPLHVDGTLTRPATPGTLPVTAAKVSGAEVTVPGQVTIPSGGTGELRVQVRPQVNLTLQADKPAVCLGDSLTLTAHAGTAYAGELPLDLNLDLPAGLTSPDRTRLQGTLRATTPGDLRVTVTPTQPGPLTFTARLTPWNQTQTVQVNVLSAATTLQLSRTPLPDAVVGDTVTVTLQVKNTAPQATAFTLTDQPGEGLQALDPTTFEGTLNPGETRAFSYRARVTDSGDTALKATLDTPACPAPQVVTGRVVAAPAAPEPTEAPPSEEQPAAQRSSVVSLPFDAPGGSIDLVIAQRPPAGAELLPGSSQLDGQALPDPKRGPSGTLYWVVPTTVDRKGVTRGTVTYALQHSGPLDALEEPALLSRFPGDRQELIAGKLDLKDLAAAQTLTPGEAQASENDGAIKLPLAGSVIRIRDRVSVIVEAPLGEAAPTLTVNGQPVSASQIGQTTEDGPRGVQRLTYVGVPLTTGPNVLQYGEHRVTVQRAGSTARMEVTPLALTADGSTPLRLKIRTLDTYGNLTAQDTVTLRSNLEPRNASSGQGGGYQLRLKDGEGILELHPQAAPTTLTLDLLNGSDVERHTYEVRPDDHRVGVGVLSATLGLDGHLKLQDDLTWQARATYEGPLAGGKVYVAADKDGLPTDRNTLQRYANYGDNSLETVPLQGLDPVAVTYDHPNFRVQYRRAAVPISVLPVGEQLTALTAYSKSNPQVSGFAALVPSDRVTNERLTPQGTRLLRLAHGNISEGSETLELVTLERATGKELRRVPLTRNVDYQLDPATGIITLTRALDALDAELNDLRVTAAYRLQSPLDQRKLAYGAQVLHTAQTFTVGAAAVSLDDRVTLGARATYDNGTTRADGLLAYSGGWQASADLGTTFGAATFGAHLRYQDEQYAGLAPFTPGLNASATLQAPLARNLSAALDAEYHAPAGQDSGGSVTARADYRAAPFSVGGGFKYAFGDTNGLGAVLSAGYHQAPLDVDVVHTQPLSGNLKPETVFTTRYKLSQNLSLGFTDKFTWGVGHAAALTLDSAIGNVNYTAAYELPNSSGQGNRARFGVTTSLPLTDHLTAGLRGSATYALTQQQLEAGAGVDLHYKKENVVATAGTDVNFTAQGVGVVVRAGVSGQLTPNLNLTADALAEFGAGKNGQRAALGYAYRDRNLVSLGTVRYVNGTLAGGQPELSSNLSAEYRQSNYAIRAGLDTRTLLNDRSSFTAQGSLSGTYYFNDRFGVGAWGHVLTQPATHTTQIGYGLEGSVRALPGTWLTAGYNFKGFDSLPSSNLYTKQGAYLRLDLTLDETSFEHR